MNWPMTTPLANYVVVEFPQEICYSDGRASGRRRGWFPANEPGLAGLLRSARVVAWVMAVADAQLLVAAASGEGAR